MNHHAHLLEERLFDCYLAERGGEVVDPRLAEHLADCEACAARYSDLAAFMDALQTDATIESDAVFTTERLRAQHAQIARRLEQVGHRARILSFPRRLVRDTMAPASSSAAPRWMAAAAAAGLFIGVAVGASYNYSSRPHLSSATLARQNAAATRLNGGSAATVNSVATGGVTPVQVASDDAFLSDLEVALERPHTRELQAFDAFTPHVREIGLRR